MKRYAPPALRLASGFFRNGENFFARVMTAVRANVMRQAHLVAIGAGSEIRRLHCQMTPAAITATFGNFSFR